MIHIITDSVSDLLPHEASQIGVEVLPLHVHFVEESFEDNITITRDEFFDRLVKAERLPKTSQLTPDAFRLAYRRALDRGDEVLAITTSSELSGTHQSAVIARNDLPPKERERVRLVDTLTVSLGQALLVHEASRLRGIGESLETIQKALLTLIPHQKLVVLIDDLKYLVMGGRLSTVGAKVGTILHLKPLVCVKAGKIELAGLTRGIRNAYEWLMQQLKDAPPDPLYPVHFASSQAAQALESFKAYLKERNMLPPTIRTMGVGAVVGTHAGPGCLAIGWIRKP